MVVKIEKKNKQLENELPTVLMRLIDGCKLIEIIDNPKLYGN